VEETLRENRTKGQTMRNFFCFFMTAAFFLPTIASSKDVIEKKTNRIFVVGRPTSVTLIKDLSGETPEGEIFFAQLYKVRIRNIRVLFGEYDFDEVAMEIQAGNRSYLNVGSIVVLFEMQGDGKPKCLHWARPVELACIPAGQVKELNLESDLKDSISYNKRQCEIIQPIPVVSRRTNGVLAH
jgi:hypothetical protein